MTPQPATYRDPTRLTSLLDAVVTERESGVFVARMMGYDPEQLPFLAWGDDPTRRRLDEVLFSMHNSRRYLVTPDPPMIRPWSGTVRQMMDATRLYSMVTSRVVIQDAVIQAAEFLHVAPERVAFDPEPI